VGDIRDPKLVHLDGLNLSCALPQPCLQMILVRQVLTDAADALKNVASGDYAGEHWLAFFAVYMLTAQSD